MGHDAKYQQWKREQARQEADKLTSSRRAGPRERSRESLGIIMSASLQLRRVIVD